ncbi:MAG: nucleotide exchange factor GrpE [Elusimicrobiota bacterium]|nr:MAG: nucleotide exchange factor GrpE [Elusimicrobiota bacterium]
MSDESQKAPTEPIGEEVSLPHAVEKGPKAEQPDYYGQLLRLKAEFENFRKRTDREKPEWIKLGAAGVLVKLLPLYDLVRHAHDDVKAGYGDTPLAKGMDAIFKEYDKLFKEEGIVLVDPLGKPFDPHYHEAFGFVDKEGYEEGSVADVLQAGFLHGDKVLRTAKVRLQQKKEQKP